MFCCATIKLIRGSASKTNAFRAFFSTRKMIKDGSEYFGPYTNFKTVHTDSGSGKRTVSVKRTCNYDLSKANIDSGKFKVCLEYHIGNCKGPCEGLESIANYEKQVQAIREILKGNFKESLKEFKKLMTDLALDVKFRRSSKNQRKD